MDREDRRRYFIVGTVIIEVVAPVFRKKIENAYQSQRIACLTNFLDHPPVLHILFHLRHINNWCCTDRPNCVSNKVLPLNYSQWKLLYSQNQGVCGRHCFCKYKANSVKEEDVDISLGSLILLNCCNLTQNEVTLIEDLRVLKNNYLSHNVDGCITLDEYKVLWPNLTTFVLQLDPSKKDDLIRIENRPLDEVLCIQYVGNLLDVHRKLDEIDAKMDAHNAVLLEKMETLLKSKACDCSKNKTTVQNEPHRLRHDIFTLHHQYNIASVRNVGRIGRIGGGMMMDDDRLVICLIEQEKLLICNTDGSEGDSIPLESKPQNVTAVNNSTVAVTMRGSHCIEMYNINNKSKLKYIQVPGECWGITTINNTLVVGCERRLLMIDNQTGEVVRTVNTDCTIPVRLHTTGDRIFYRDHSVKNNYNLYCYSYTDDKVTTLALPFPPNSITSLQDGSLYVVCGNGSVQHVSSDGQHFKSGNTNGLESLKNCYLISYNETQRKLFTCDIYGKAKIFKKKINIMYISSIFLLHL